MASPLSADRLLRALKAEGVRVVEHRSWRTHNRNHAGSWGPVHGVMIHHTVTRGTDSSVELCYNGHSSLPGPLCHGVIAKDGTVYMVGHGRANHAGAGDGDVLAAVIAERALPPDNETDTDGNRHFYGFECINMGDNKDPWPPEQVSAIVRASAAICRAHGWGKEGTTSVIGHLEWQPGKIDPRGPGVSMSDVRRRVAERLRHPADWDPEEDDMPLSDEDIRKVAVAAARQVALYKDERLDRRDARQMWDDAASPHTTWQFRPEGAERDAWGYLSRTHAEVVALRAAVAELASAVAAGSDSVDADDLVARIERAIASASGGD
ncbi:N-acetylmuramoyl-L-alanine amidase [Streptomyces radicis]|uniref:N-acetylmuramoyl-L-alanine amidase n=1 Tax=Streptomyces radicis TaxID=1750517 RepID=A0A3A9W711_9ACTN|nr:peptidoglycan recognition family protein [Streptomyces radicis]RKN08975.1 N-acetylmuramoyl-L-alanine amidase [Streptomyces radicis]RKN22834.1 N-acetylmuramoyl-L-alanine amidase [Streptomyces radicis]